MSRQKYEQPFLDGFLKADSDAREAMIDEETRQIHLARQFIRFDKASRVCKNETLKKQLERYKIETLKLMERR